MTLKLTMTRIGFLALMMIWPFAAFAQGAVLFADPNLEHAVRDTLNKPAGDLTSADLLQLTSLYAPNYRIRDLSGLEAARNLKVLNVTQNDITNAAALAGMPQLTSLDLSYNYVRDLSPLHGLANLTSLSLAALSLEALPPLGNYPELKDLTLAYNQISDPTPLRGLTGLRYLNLTANPVSSVALLCGMTNLQSLSLGEMAITNADCLSCFTELVGLVLYNNQISNVTALLGLPRLQSLDLSANPVGDWTPIAGLTNLVGLDICEGSLTNLEWLAELQNLKYLRVSHSSIADVSPLRALTNLFSLDLSRNPVTNYMKLAPLTNLHVLYVQGSSLTDLSFAASLPRLLGLSVTWNRVAELTPLAGLTNLSWLEAGFNVLTNIDALRDLSSLHSASLHRNLLDLTPGSANMAVIQDLQSKGLSVNYQPQVESPRILVRPQWFLPAGQKSWLTFLVPDGANSWVEPPKVGAHSSDTALVPEINFATTHSFDSYSWDLAVTPAANKTGTASLTLAATNYAGLRTNVTVEVKVAPPTPFNGETLDAPDLVWFTGGDSPWFGQNTVSHDGPGAAQSGAQDSWLLTTVTGPGTLRYWFKLESDYYYANAQFSAISHDSNLHGYEHLHRRGQIWQEQIVGLPSGNWTLKWSPSWDSWSYGGLNTLWLDQVSFTAGVAACWLEPYIYSLSTGGCEFYLHGVLGQTYEVEVSDDLRNWSLLTRVKCVIFETAVRDLKVGPKARFYRARPVRD